MPGNSSTVLALFSPQPPVEPTAPKADRASDSDFRDFLSNAQVDRSEKTSPKDSANNNNETEIGQAEKSKPKIKNHDKPEKDDARYQETAASIGNEPVTKTENVTRNSVLEDSAALAAKLKELGIEQEEFEALLEHLGLKGDLNFNSLMQSLTGLKGDLNFNSLMQSLTQGLNQNGLAGGKNLDALTHGELVARLQQHEGEALDLLKKAGLTDAQAKNLLDHLKSTPLTTLAQKEGDKSLDLNLNKNIQAQQDAAAAEKLTLKTTEQSESSKNTGQHKNDTNVPLQVKDTSKKTDKMDRAAALDKLSETSKIGEAPRITPPEPSGNKGTQTSNLNQLLNDNNAQATLVQTDAGKDAGSFKGLESAKSGPDLQVQAATAAADNAIKAVESNKSVLPEKLIARGATEAKIINQIISKLNVRSGGGKSEVQIRLDPPSLGTIRLNIITVGDSVRTVIVAENHAVKQTIENNFNQLRDAMGEQGLKVDSFSVTVGGESGNHNGKQFGEKDSADSQNQEQITSSGNEGDVEDFDASFIFDGNQSISVLA